MSAPIPKGLTKPLPIRLTASAGRQLVKLSNALNVPMPVLTRLAVTAGLPRLLNAFGPSSAGAEPPATVPLLQVSPVTAARLAELDQLLNMEPGQGIANLLLGDILRDFKAGSLDVLNCWEWEDPEATAEAVRAIADRWRQEDGEPDDPTDPRDMRGRWEIENRRQGKEGVDTVYTPTGQKGGQAA